MKYVMFSIPGLVVREMPIMFPDLLAHIDVAKAVQAGVPELKNATVVSAGSYDPVSCECFDGSTTLQVESREQDGKIILAYDYLHGIVM